MAATGAPLLSSARLESQQVASARHFKALVQKNGLLKRREWSAQCLPWCPLAAFCELLLPLGVIALLWWAKSACANGGQCELPILEGWGGDMPNGNKTTKCVEGLVMTDSDALTSRSSCDAWTDKTHLSLPFVNVLSYLHWSGKRLALAVEDPNDRPKAERIRQEITEDWFPDMKMANIPCLPLEEDLLGKLSHKMHPGEEFNGSDLPCLHKPGPHPGILPGFANLTYPEIMTSKELDRYLDSKSYGSHGFLFGAVVFSSIGGDGHRGGGGKWAYSIRLNVSSGTAIYTREPATRPLDLGLKTLEARTYLTRGFSSLQLLVDRHIVGVKAEGNLSTEELLKINGLSKTSMHESEDVKQMLAEPLFYAPQAVSASPMPVNGIVVDGFYTLIELAFPLVFIVAFLYTQKKVLNELIAEKESKVRESLRMLGVRSSAIISSWFITYGLIFAFLCIVFAVVSNCYVFPASNASVIFAFFWLWCMSFLAFAWFIHSFFNHSRTGGIVGMIIMFAQWIIYASQNQQGPPDETVTNWLMLMPNAAFCTGLAVLSKFEASRVGARWTNLNMPVSNTSFAMVLGMMVLDVILYTGLGWYLDRVIPKEFGVRLPLNFLCSQSYWKSDRNSDSPSRILEAPSAVCAAENAAEEVPESLRNKSMATGCLVQTQGLRREFQTPGGTKVAVAGLDLTMYDGQILALLGHNGAGKSTTINMLTGMVEPSSGDAIIAGHSLKDGIGHIRQLIGVCPQHDVLWAELTVLEHLTVYARLRGVAPGEVAQRATEMMQDVGLTEKALTRAGSLSGGQKRKLSLCLALIGRPPVVFLDEPTSGMDPFSRRSTWNIIRGAREGRVVVLTTHFMDEADILGDRIAIMAEGELQCCGSSLFLKARLGAGYRLICARKSLVDGSESIEKTVKRHVPEAQRLTDIGAELTLQLPSSATSCFNALLSELDAKKEELGLAHYGLSMVTLEEVFLKVASGDMDSLGQASTQAPSPASQASSPNPEEGTAPQQDSMRPGVAIRHLAALFMKRARYGHRDFKALACTVLLPVALLAFGLGILNYVGNPHAPTMPLSVASQYSVHSVVPYNQSYPAQSDPTALLHAFGHDLQPLAENVSTGYGKSDGIIFGVNYSAGLPEYELCSDMSMFGKCWKENNLCAKILPLVQLGRSVAIQVGCDTDKDSCKAAFSSACDNGAFVCANGCVKQTSLSASVCRSECEQVCAMSSSIEEACSALQPPIASTLASICPVECASNDNPDTCPIGTVCEQKWIPPLERSSDVLSFLMQLFSQGGDTEREDTRYGALLLSDDSKIGTSASLLYNTSAPHAVPTFQNLLSNVLLHMSAGSGAEISLTSHPMPRSQGEKLNQIVSAVVNLTSTFVIIIAFSWIPAAIVAYIVREREAHHNCKHQQLISGVSLIAYWIANFLWDICLYAAPLSLSILFLKLFNIDAFVSNGALWASFVVFLGYGLAITPFSYLLSFLFAKHTTAQVLCLVINFLTGLLLMLTSYILGLIESTQAVNEKLMWIYRLFPGFCLGHGLFEICTNSVALAQLGLQTEVDLLGWDVAGKDAMYLYVSAPCFFAVAVLVDYLAHSPLAAATKVLDPAGQVAQMDEEDEDVLAEAGRVASGAADGDIVRLAGLRKVYRTPEGQPKVAVKNLSFGLAKGECFGFLGINGAGKTSTLNMLTGAILPSGGNAYLGGHDVVKEQWKVRRLLGYCPQHDALLDRLTVREHLELFGRIKGIPRAELRGYCDRMMRNLSLESHVDKLSMTLSGGNKRKLSLAISLMGAPPLVFLDEPSTGVDPAARRLMWNVISEVSTRRKESTVMLTTHNMEEAEALCARIGIMVGGRLRCIGSNQHLKARFGSGYQLEARLRPPSAATIADAVRQWHLPPVLGQAELSEQCTLRGKPGRLSLVRDGCEEGYLIYDALHREGSVTSSVFAEWWISEDQALALGAYLARHFEGTVPLERHERTFRFRLPVASSLAEVFRLLEESRTDICLEEYGVSQTTLEQIFNDFAAMQQEETGPVRGLFADGRTIQNGVGGDPLGSVEMSGSVADSA